MDGYYYDGMENINESYFQTCQVVGQSVRLSHSIPPIPCSLYTVFPYIIWYTRDYGIRPNDVIRITACMEKYLTNIEFTMGFEQK